MSKRKGVSADEKRVRMLQLFYEKREFFQLKDLEKIAPKEKGIVAQSVKDVVQALVDDGLIDTDKIGTSIYFWAFPGKNIKLTEKNIEEANQKIFEAEMKIAKISEEILREKVEKEDSIERQKLIQEVTKLQRRETKLQKELAEHMANDPEEVAELTKKAEKYKDGTNAWTDNIFAIQSWCNKKFDISKTELNKQFNIAEDLDYIE
ncbi:meiotic nuclear division protein 1 homolog [Diprion similis]|uniref:meiotic nuclear division protein 1 homolog n=1 Tax=Diprion similis TaxID=362088 RepID=UPI001EF8A8B8|nr:meiotic nuclear division protein 1 homolog [Diprion similis]XP_046752491.1 meiotic nuclear division protein 1 homolog [Diprion similis]